MADLFYEESDRYLIESVIENGFANRRTKYDADVLIDIFAAQVESSRLAEFGRIVQDDIMELGVVCDTAEIVSFCLEKSFDDFFEIKDCLNRDELWIEELLQSILSDIDHRKNTLAALNRIADIDEERTKNSRESVTKIVEQLKDCRKNMYEGALEHLIEDLDEIRQIKE